MSTLTWLRGAESMLHAFPLRRALLVAISSGMLVIGAAQGAEPASGSTSDSGTRAIEAFPARLRLGGRYDGRQLLLTATLENGRVRDVTAHARYEVGDPRLARITPRGRVVPLADGTTEIVATFGSLTTRIPLQVADCAKDLPINFPNQVVPIFTKLGCNSGGCHGKQSGQNGFRLSLLGFDPELDYETLVQEDRGRRVFLAAPEQSLMLLKATGAIPHGGGRKLDPDSDDYQIVRRWIAAGAPPGRVDENVLVKLTVYPERRLMSRRNEQQLIALAEYSNGTVEDVTRRAHYESNDREVAAVDDAGLVATQDLSGESAVMVRYQGQVAVFRATVPLDKPAPHFDFPEATLVDRYTSNKWRELGLAPSEICSDAEFLRRASLDIAGTLPGSEDVRAFCADRDANKRARLVDRLVDSDGYTNVFSHKWADILHVTRRNQQNRAHGTFAFHAWIRDAIAKDLPYNEFAREILQAIGEETHSPATVWYKELQTPEQLTDDTAQVFLGLRIACAQCHHHPYEKWSQDDYWGLAAFFGRLRRKPVIEPGVNLNGEQPRQALYVATAGSVTNKRSRRPASIKPLDGAPVDVANGEDPRRMLVDWMSQPKNPFFGRAIANRYWAHFFGRGIVDPLDDMRATNPPSNPELLDALADNFVAHGYSLKHLVRTICKSRTYQLSAVPNEFNRHDKHAYARYYPKRLGAEVLYDALSRVLNAPAPFPGLPTDTHAPKLALMLPDESFRSYFLDVFGRPQRLSACECERVTEANLAQVLHLLNSNEVQRWLSSTGGRADMLAQDQRADRDKVEELFLCAFAHGPTDDQMSAALEHLEKAGARKKTAYENILWSLINSKEFSFNR